MGEAFDELVHLEIASGDLDAAIDSAERRLSLDRLNEPTYRSLMQLHAWKGDRAAAVRRYGDCVAVLESELGVPPLDETTALYASIIEGTVTMQPASIASPHALPQAPGPPAMHATPSKPPLIGRDEQLGALVGAYESAGRNGLLLVVEGEAGIGKSRLAQEFADHVTELGAPTVTARCHEGESGLPYAVVADALSRLSTTPSFELVPPASRAEAARLLPRLGRPGPPLPLKRDPSAETRFFEGLLDVFRTCLSHDPPGLLVLDDLQWADAASLDLLSYMFRRLGGKSLAVLVAWRSEEMDDGSLLRRSVARAHSEGRARTIALDRLDAKQVRALAAEVLSEAEALRIGDALYEETEGVPFYLVEYLATMGSAEPTPGMPSGVKDLLRTHVGLVGAVARQLLTTAAVIDRSFEFETLWRASGRSELEALDAVDELVSRGLLVADALEPDPPSYRFSHDRLRAYVYEQMSPARRRVLHRRVADALSLGSPKQDGVPILAGPIARHLELGDRGNEAAKVYADAGWLAARLFANRDALDHLMSAIALGHPEAAVLHEGIGDMHTLLGEYRKALTSYETAAVLFGEANSATIERKLGDVHIRRGEWDSAEHHLEAALHLGQDPTTRAEILADLSLTAFRRRTLERAGQLAGESLDQASLAGDRRALAQAHNIVGIVARACGEIEDSIAHLTESLDLAQAIDEPAAEIAALNNLALAERSRGELSSALDLTERALALCNRLGDRHREAALHNNLADLLHATGDSPGAMDHLKQAAQIFGDIGIEPTGMLPEVWKLVEW
jgi:tetratricopeptide (TPR) repeat protein